MAVGAPSPAQLSTWSVPAGTERRRFLTVWLCACLANGCSLTWTAWRHVQSSPHSGGVWLYIYSQELYVLLYFAIVWALVFNFTLYRRYKMLIDLSHLIYCQIPHILSSYFPPGGSPVPVNFPATHAFILLLNPLAHNLPPWCYFSLMATIIPSHLLIQHNSLAFHLPGLPAVQYMQYMLATALAPAALATLIMLHSGRTDMPPADDDGAPAEPGGLRSKRQDVPHAASSSSPRPQAGRQVTRFLRVFHRAQLQFRANSRPVLIALACAMTLTQLIQALFFFAAGRGKMEVTLHMGELVASLTSMYILGSSNVLTDIQPRLNSALNLIHDLVPVHIANALLDQEHSSNSSTRHSYSTASQRHSAAGAAPAIPTPKPPPPPHPAAEGFRGWSEDGCLGHKAPGPPAPEPTALALGHELTAAVAAKRQGLAPTLVQRMLAALTGPDDSLVQAQGKLFGGSSSAACDASMLDDMDETAGLACWHESASILFADIVGFTECSQAVTPREVMRMLNELYVRYDGLCMGDSKVAKIETIGDCYMSATGLLHDDPDHALTMLKFAAEMTKAAQQVLMPHNGQPVRVRVGIHSGRVMSGVVGLIRKRFCLFGDTVNTASRMESNGVPGRIHISSATRDLIVASGQQQMWNIECRGTIPIKGKGDMTTYFVEPAAAVCLDPLGSSSSSSGLEQPA